MEQTVTTTTAVTKYSATIELPVEHTAQELEQRTTTTVGIAMVEVVTHKTTNSESSIESINDSGRRFNRSRTSKGKNFFRGILNNTSKRFAGTTTTTTTKRLETPRLRRRHRQLCIALFNRTGHPCRPNEKPRQDSFDSGETRLSTDISDAQCAALLAVLKTKKRVSTRQCLLQ